MYFANVRFFFCTTSNIPLMLGYGTYNMYKICFIYMHLLALLRKFKYAFYIQ